MDQPQNYLHLDQDIMEGKVGKSPPWQDHDPNGHQNLINCSFYYPRPFPKNLLQSVHNFLSNVTNRQINATEKIISLFEITVSLAAVAL